MEKGIAAEIADSLPELGGVSQTCGSHDAGGLRFGIVVSRFNTELVQALVTTAVSCLTRAGAAESDISVHWVPGAFEIPLVLQRLAAADQCDALIALGCVIEGETPHADLITVQVARCISDISREFDLPVIDAVVATRNLEQAQARCLGGEGSRGWYAAQAAIEMATLGQRLKEAT